MKSVIQRRMEAYREARYSSTKWLATAPSLAAVMTCRSALKNIEIIEREGLVENSRLVGAYLHERLLGLKDKYEVIKDVRGRGLLQGIEIEGSEKADKYVLGQEFYETMLRNGLITELESRKNLENVVVVMHPALITSRENVDEAVEIIDKSLSACIQ